MGKKSKSTKYYDDTNASSKIASIKRPKTPNPDGKKPRILNPKTIKISSSFSPPPTKNKLKTHQSESPLSTSTSTTTTGSGSGHISSPSLPDSFADKKKLWSKRSSKSSSDKKKKGKK